MRGVCTRFAVLRKSDGLPIEGTLYSERSKANKRHYGTADPSQFYVEEVAVLALKIAHQIIEALPNKSQ